MTPHETPGAQPTYYRTTTDLDVLNDLDNFNRHDAVHVITDRPVDPYSEDAVAEWEMRAARASEEELAEWRAAYDALVKTAAGASEKLAAAKAAWEKARQEALGELRAAYAAYEHVHDTIEKRHGEVEALRQEAENDRTRQEQAEADRAQAAEDAELGPRTWVIYELTTVDANYYGKKKTPDMFLPMIHVAGCAVTKGREKYDHEKAWRYARAIDVRAAISAGGSLAANGRRTGKRAAVRMCGRCKPEESMRQAGLGDAYDEWRAETDVIQPPIPADRYLVKRLDLGDDWRGWSKQRSGFVPVHPDSYREKGAIAKHEFLLGWWDADRQTVDRHAQSRLAYLEQVLPGRGFAVRKFDEPKEYGGGECLSARAVRLMTPGEVRQHKEDAAELAQRQAQAGPVHTVSLEDGADG